MFAHPACPRRSCFRGAIDAAASIAGSGSARSGSGCRVRRCPDYHILVPTPPGSLHLLPHPLRSREKHGDVDQPSSALLEGWEVRSSGRPTGSPVQRLSAPCVPWGSVVLLASQPGIDRLWRCRERRWIASACYVTVAGLGMFVGSPLPGIQVQRCTVAGLCLGHALEQLCFWSS